MQSPSFLKKNSSSFASTHHPSSSFTINNNKTIKIEQLIDLLRNACRREMIFWAASSLSARNHTNDHHNHKNPGDDVADSLDRDESIAFLSELMFNNKNSKNKKEFGVDTFSVFVSMLDLFLARFKVKAKYLECVSCACLFIACKVREEKEHNNEHNDNELEEIEPVSGWSASKFISDCEARCSVGELMRMETAVLNKLEWTVNAPIHSDLLHVLHAIFVAEYKQLLKKKKNEFTTSNQMDFSSSSPRIDNIWKMKHAKSFKLDTANNKEEMNIKIKQKEKHQQQQQRREDENENDNDKDDDSYFTSNDLIETVEHQLKQVLCISDLTGTYRPLVLAFCILSQQINNNESSSSTGNLRDGSSRRIRRRRTTELERQVAQECLQALDERLRTSGMMSSSTVFPSSVATIGQCKTDLKFHLNELNKKSDESSFDRFLQEYHCKVVNRFRESVQSVPNHDNLPSIVEERESDEEMDDKSRGVMFNFSSGREPGQEGSEVVYKRKRCDSICFECKH